MLFTEHRQKIKYFKSNISKIIEISIKDLKNLLKKLNKPDIKLVTNIEKDLNKVKFDKEDIYIVLKNMYDNAIDALSDGGIITITAKNFEGIPPESSLDLNKYVHISIEDNGIGMDEKAKNNIFTPFFTTKDPGRRKGMGVSEAYIIIREHYGSILVESEISKGTVIHIYLPSLV
jgi:signal transduction histidine kinase